MSSERNRERERSLAGLLAGFGRYIRSEEVRSAAGRRTCDFTRVHKLPWYDMIMLMTFRNEKCIPSEMAGYYATIGKPDRRISRQAFHKAARKTNPEVFLRLVGYLAGRFYGSGLVKDHKGYVVLAVDGTCNSLPPCDEALEALGFAPNQHSAGKESANAATSRSSALYDVTNGLVVDFVLEKYEMGEIPMAVRHVRENSFLFAGRKPCLVADRGYPSVELFAVCEAHGFGYCIRGKPNFFKKAMKGLRGDDGWIDVEIDDSWMKRLKYDEAKERFAKERHMRVRVVRKSYAYVDRSGTERRMELVYYTDLPETEFTSDEIVRLYAMRWDIEVSYKTLKTDQEWERFFSAEYGPALCAIYAKVLFHCLLRIVAKELDHWLRGESPPSGKGKWRANMAQVMKALAEYGLCRCIRSWNFMGILRIMGFIYEQRHKLKNAVRDGRHHERWGRRVSIPHPMRFRIDGRNWPKVRAHKGSLFTVRP